MPRTLTPQETVLLQQDTHYLDAGIPIWGSRVLIWQQMNNMAVLVYHTQNYGYATTDITDLGPSTIAALAKQSEVHGMWYYLPQEMQDVIHERVEQVISVAESGGKTVAEIMQYVGQTVADTIKPLVDTLMVPLIIASVLLGLYLFKKG